MKGVVVTPPGPIKQWLPCCVILIQPQRIQDLTNDILDTLSLSNTADKPSTSASTGQMIKLAEGSSSALASTGVSHSESLKSLQEKIEFESICSEDDNSGAERAIPWARYLPVCGRVAFKIRQGRLRYPQSSKGITVQQAKGVLSRRTRSAQRLKPYVAPAHGSRNPTQTKFPVTLGDVKDELGSSSPTESSTSLSSEDDESAQPSPEVGRRASSQNQILKRERGPQDPGSADNSNTPPLNEAPSSDTLSSSETTLENSEVGDRLSSGYDKKSAEVKKERFFVWQDKKNVFWHRWSPLIGECWASIMSKLKLAPSSFSENRAYDFPREDGSIFGFMVRCFLDSVAKRFPTGLGVDFMSSNRGTAPWLAHWFCYGFAMPGERCILEVVIQLLKQSACILTPEEKDVAPSLWRAYDSAEASVRRLYCILYTAFDVWRASRIQPPPQHHTILDEELLRPLLSCERLYKQLERFDNEEDVTELCGWMKTRKPLILKASKPLVVKNLFSDPIAKEIVSAHDPFLQMMFGIAGLFHVAKSKRAGVSNQGRFAVNAAFDLFYIRYSGPKQESVHDGLTLRSDALRDCVSYGFLTPQYLQWIASCVESCTHTMTRQHMIDLLFITANFFMQWAKLYDD
eukprot:Blabericola_migrator_1__1312@NODE_1340_length_4761_cov_9_806135_g899_i0_p1_GENE_NODE_1340_length_4761_cov_9_806135_g899_i0NODE_1340_length_4761_cov_9_806135_g899_i0_p1_ORF_typecomplete_len630_score61_88_NODE_1340_length_4761_cov_9_806135_g899_i023474236